MSFEGLLPDSIRRSYLRKFALVVVAIALVIGTYGVYAQAGAVSEVKEQRQSELRTLSTEEAGELGQYLETQRDRAGLLAENNDFQQGAATRGNLGIRASLGNQRERFDDNVYAIHYVDRDTEEIVVSTKPDDEGRLLNAPGIAWQNSLIFENESDVDGSSVYTHDGNSLLAFASPIENTNKMIVLAVDASRVGADFSNSIEGGKTLAVGDQGRIEFSPNNSEILSRYEGGENATEIRRGIDGESGTTVVNGTLIGYAPVEGSDRVVIKQAPVENAYSVANAVQQDIAILIAVALLGFAALGTVVHRGTITTLREISATAGAVAEGDLDRDVTETDRIDEIGGVQRAFGDVQRYLGTVAGQADAIAEQDFDAAVLDEEVPGDLGVALETMQRDLEAFVAEVEQARDDARESQERAEELAATLRRQAEAFSETMDRAADGDLTQRLDSDIDNDAMRSIAEATNTMLADLEQAVVEIQAFAREVEGTTEQVTASAEEVENASEEVSRSIQEIADGAERQNENVQQVSGEMSNLSATVEEIASSSNEVAQKSSRAAEVGEDGRARATEAIDVMGAIGNQADATIAEVENLDAEMDEIGEIVTLIDEIAEQTNMLALNASIEAARAGEAGEGFAVVADEIKQLAAETTEATEEVADLVGDVQAATGHAVTDIREMGEQVDDGIDTVEAAIAALEEIVTQVEEANTGIQSIDDATDEQASSTEEAVSMVDEVGSISEETASRAESAAAAAEEQTATLSEVTGSIESLSDQATSLGDLLAQFEVGDDTGPSSAGSESSPGVATDD